MHFVKSILLLIVMIHISSGSLSQQLSPDIVLEPMPQKKWSFSFSLGVIAGGPGKAMTRDLKKVGFGDKPPDFDFFGLFTIPGIREFPEVRKKAVWEMETRYVLSQHSAVALSVGKSLHYRANGYSRIGYESTDGTGYEHYLTIVHDVWFVSADYILRLPSGYGGLAVGPVMAFHRVSEGPSSNTGSWTTTVKPGFHVGVDFPFFQKKSWFMAFGLNYTWLPSVGISPQIEKIRSTNAPSFSLSTFQLSLTTGWKF